MKGIPRNVIVKAYLILLCSNYRCMTLAFNGLGGNDLQVEKIEPYYSSLTLWCQQIKKNEYMLWFSFDIII